MAPLKSSLSLSLPFVLVVALAGALSSGRVGLSFAVLPSGKATPGQPEAGLQTPLGPAAVATAAAGGLSATAGASLALLGASVAITLLTRHTVASAIRRPKEESSARQLVSLAAFEGELGVQAPVGFWDPLGLSRDGDVATFKRRRETEIKHGRVSMLAAIGYIVPEYFKFPGYLSPSTGLAFADVPNGLAAFSKVPGAGVSQFVIFCGLVEVKFGFGEYAKGGEPGDYGWKAITSSDPETKKRKLSAEIANGRLAMMAIIGMFYQDGLTGSAWGDWALYTDSPLRAEPISAAAAAVAAVKAAAAAGAAKGAAGAGAAAAAKGLGAAGAAKAGAGATASLGAGVATKPKEEDKGANVSSFWSQPAQSSSPFGPGPFDPTKQVGALPPLGFWDPAGLCTDEATFRKYRTAEIKHARVAMMAAIGLNVAHGSKFAWIDEGVPAGLAALQDPGAAQGFAILFLCAGFYELTFWTEDESKAPGDFGDPAGWTATFQGLAYDDELRNRELNNGRFAMFAVIGILVAEQATGLDGTDQFAAAIQRWQSMGGLENF